MSDIYAHVCDGAVRTVAPLAFPDLPLAAQVAPAIAAQMVRLTTEQAAIVRPGWFYEEGTFIAPPEEPEPPAPRSCTPREFRQRFTIQERGALTLAASQLMEQGDPSLQVFLDDLSASQVVEMTHPDTVAGMAALVAGGLLSQERADEILTGVAPPAGQAG